MCTHEMDVPGAMPLCIRILMHVNSEIAQKDIKHIYQNEAVKLRPDLQNKTRTGGIHMQWKKVLERMKTL